MCGDEQKTIKTVVRCGFAREDNTLTTEHTPSPRAVAALPLPPSLSESSLRVV